MLSALQPASILLIEDSPSDVRLAREALEFAGVSISLHVVTDGVEAMAFLHRAGAYLNAPRPSLILLDLNLPRKDGREVLSEIKGDEALKRIPVVVLTTSKSDADIQRAYGLHANCYIVKPVDFERFTQIMRGLEHFWFDVVTLASPR
jgi:CheY-like chemotaxis protein